MRIKIKLTSLILFSIIFASLFALVSSIDFSFTWTYPTNGSTYDTNHIWANITLNDSYAEYCTVDIGNTNGTVFANVSTSNDSATTAYVNITDYLTDSAFGKWHNLTYYCNDTLGNVSSSSLMQFRTDTTDPTITSWWNFTQTNTTSDAYLNVGFNITDKNIDSCGVRLYQEDGTYITKTGSLTAVAESRNCSVNLTSSDVTESGDFIIERWANDSAGNIAYSSNETGLVNILKGGKWNLVTYSGLASAEGTNETIASILNRLPGCTHISLWNNSKGWKNYTTYAASTPSVNNDTQVWLGNATWIYCSEDEIYYRKNYINDEQMGDDTKVELVINGTATGTKWNLFGMLVDKTLNQTLYPATTAISNGYQQNITAVSWYNASSGYITCVKDFAGTLCTGGYNATEVSIPKSTAVWMLVTDDLTLNRTGI